jgi:hypothetical protein
MPKRTKYPGLRRHSWTTAQGERKTAYYFAHAVDGKRTETPLGTDHAEALRKWHALAFDKPREAGTLKEAFDRWELEVLEHKKPVTKRDYSLALTQLRPVFGRARWDEVTLPVLRAYLMKRTAKRRGNLELSVLSAIWNWARLTPIKLGSMEPLTPLPWPAAGLERSKWKNEERPREFEVTDALFAAVYVKADEVLRDCMDIASATGLRLTDVRTFLLPADGVLRGRASKTGKPFATSMADSPVLAPIWSRRKAYRVNHLMLLSTPTREVSYLMLRDRWNAARIDAAADPANKAIRAQIEAMWLRDMRSRAADLAETGEEARELLQHADQRTTDKHYRTKVKTLRAVR